LEEEDKMRSFLLVVIALIGCSHAAPTNLQQLEDLKAKLRTLHDVLDDLNSNIDALETKQEDAREMVPEPPAVKTPDADTANFINSLSPEDKEALEKMKSKLKFLQAAVHDGPGHDIPAKDGFAEEQPLKKESLPEADQALLKEKRAEDELEEFVSRLSEDDKALLERMKSKIGNLKAAIEAEKEHEAE